MFFAGRHPRHELSQPSIWVRHRISLLSCKVVSAYVGLRQCFSKEGREDVLKNNRKLEWAGTNRHTAGDIRHGQTCRVSDELAFCSRNDRTAAAHRRHPLLSLHPLWLRPRIDSSATHLPNSSRPRHWNSTLLTKPTATVSIGRRLHIPGSSPYYLHDPTAPSYVYPPNFVKGA